MTAFLLDALRVMKDLSVKMQRRYGLIVEQYDLFDDFHNSVQQLGELKSHYFVNLLIMSECTMTDGDTPTICRNIDNYFTAEKVTYKGLPIDQAPVPLSPPPPRKTTAKPRRGRKPTRRPVDSSTDDDDDEDDDDGPDFKTAAIRDADSFRYFKDQFVELTLQEVDTW